MIEVFVSFIGGLLSFFSPCFFPLIPAYISLITGVSLRDIKDKNFSHSVLFYSVFFILGFSITFSILGASAAFLGKILKAYKNEIMLLSGILLIILGLNLIGVLRIPGFLKERRFDVSKISLPKYVFPLIFGTFFAVGWTPCIGPILAGILVIASSYEVVYGAFLLFVFSLGIGIPFLLSSIFISKFLEFSYKFKKFLRSVEFVSGVLLIAFGIVFSFNKLNAISISFFDFSSFEERLMKFVKSEPDVDEELIKSRKALISNSSEIYRRIFSGKYKPINNIFPTESIYIIVNFWSTNCNPCKKEIPDLIKANSKYEVAIISIADDTRKNILNFLSDGYNINYPIFLIEDILGDGIYSPYGLPESLFFYNGKFVGRYIGIINEDIIKKFLSLDFSFLEEE
ncbi:MAG: sulfite exporter TauE/SafE family protein [bacterium]|nr:sulfite exporter TauE/SafE family protein [bacterium]